jgi:hypothetical protein
MSHRMAFAKQSHLKLWEDLGSVEKKCNVKQNRTMSHRLAFAKQYDTVQVKSLADVEQDSLRRSKTKIPSLPRKIANSLDGSKLSHPRNALLGKGYVSCLDGDERSDADPWSRSFGARFVLQ